jgi:hypothetical protein
MILAEKRGLGEVAETHRLKSVPLNASRLVALFDTQGIVVQVSGYSAAYH